MPLPEPDLAAAFADHDRLFKELLTVFFADFVALFLPQIAANLDRNSISFLDKEVFTDVTSGEKREVDIVARARVKDTEAFFLIRVENQSSSQPGFPRRMFHYFARLDEIHALPVYPVALFSFEKPQRAEPDRYAVEFGTFKVLDFHFHSIQLNRLSWRDFLNKPNPVAAALMARMKIARTDRPRVKLECLRLLATLKLDPARTRLISGFVDSYLQLTAQEMREFLRAIEALPTAEKEAAMPLTISWKEEGRLEGERQMLRLAAESRLGAPSQQALARLEKMDSSERLEVLMRRLFQVESWDDLLADEA